MRTTINLDDDLHRRLRDLAQREGISFRELLQRVILRGLEPVVPVRDPRYVGPSYSMGEVRKGVDLVKALQIAADLEDEEIIRKMNEGR